LIPKPGKPDFGRRRGGAISLLTSHAIALGVRGAFRALTTRG
jgi:hypothetical protein